MLFCSIESYGNKRDKKFINSSDCMLRAILIEITSLWPEHCVFKGVCVCMGSYAVSIAKEGNTFSNKQKS